MGINGVGSYHTQDYALQNRNRSVGRNSSISDDESIGNATSLSESSDNGKRIGITTVGNVGYIAMYADSSTEQDPIVKVGDYEVRVKDVNPNNATKMEMFALMSYMEDKGLINNQGMKSFNKMTAYATQAEYNGYCSGISDEDAAWTVERDWIGILESAEETFLGIPQTYQQGLNCQKLIDGLSKWNKVRTYSDTHAIDNIQKYAQMVSIESGEDGIARLEHGIEKIVTAVNPEDGKEYLTYFTKDTIVCQSTESSNEAVWTMEITEEQSGLINKYFERYQASQEGEPSWYRDEDLGMVSSKEYWLGFFEGAEVSDDFIDFAPNAPDEVREAFMNAAEEAVEYAMFLEEKINGVFVKIQNGDTEATYQIGTQSFTEKEWEEFLDKFDSVEEAIRELMKEEQARKEASETKKENAVMNDTSMLLTTESTSCVYETADPKDDDIRYITWYTEEGIFCRKAGQTEGYEWSITFENKEQYDKVMEFIGQFPSDWNMRFAAHENFWNDFLNDEIDMEGFMEFINGTNKGIPDFSVTVGECMYVDNDKVQWAKYTNPLGIRFFTAEEMYQMKAELIEKNTANAHKLSDPYSILYKKLHPEYNGERIFCEYPGGPLYTADEIMEIMNRNLKDAKYQAEARK